MSGVTREKKTFAEQNKIQRLGSSTSRVGVSVYIVVLFIVVEWFVGIRLPNLSPTFFLCCMFHWPCPSSLNCI